MIEFKKYYEEVEKINKNFKNKEKGLDYYKNRIQLLQDKIIELKVCNWVYIIYLLTVIQNYFTVGYRADYRNELYPFTISSELEPRERDDKDEIKVFRFIKDEVCKICKQFCCSSLFTKEHKTYVRDCLYKVFLFCYDNLYDLENDLNRINKNKKDDYNVFFNQNIIDKSKCTKNKSKFRNLFTNDFIEDLPNLSEEIIDLISILNNGERTKYLSAICELSNINSTKRNWNTYCKLMEIMRNEILHRDPYEFGLDQIELLMYSITLIINFCYFHKVHSINFEIYNLETNLKEPQIEIKDDDEERKMEINYYYYCFNIFWLMFRNDNKISNIQKKQMKELLEEILIFV